MWRLFRDCSGNTFFLLRVLLLCSVLVNYTNNQNIPTRDTDYEFSINQRNLFYDNHRIPDGIDVTPYLFVNATTKFFFLLETKTDALEITISPCASPIIWQVTFKPSSDIPNRYDIGNYVDSSEVGFHPVVNAKDSLYNLYGEAGETLRIDDPAEGIYIVDITSTKTDSYVQIFATTYPEVERYPDLPTDYNVSELDKNSKSFTVGWQGSPDERHFGDDIEYCVAINRKRSYKTICSVLAHLNGDPKPTLPPNSGFGFETDVLKKRVLRQKAKPIKAARKGSIVYKCIGREKTLTFDNIKQGNGYFIDVFVNNKQTGKSRPYHGAFIKTKRKRRLPRLKDGKIKSVSFSKRKNKYIFSFKVKRTTRDVYLAVSNCVGTTIVEVKSKNATFYRSKIKSSDILTLKDLNPGIYYVALIKSVSRKQNVYISLTTRLKAQDMPLLPSDTTVLVFDYLTTCNSITVAWMGTDKKQKYCLYKTELTSRKEDLPAISKKLNQCGALDRKQNGAQKITCKKYRRHKSVLSITVARLKPDTNYTFDVFVNKGRFFSFPYNSVRTKTSANCYLPT
ncbi:hypothetical protein ACF0H5_001362 [Mactra antiquata]